jgi:Protein of unknown function (DUF3304)
VSLRSFCNLGRVRYLCLMALLSSSMVSGCFEEGKSGVSYFGANHTNEAVADVTLNGQGGIMIAYPHGTSGDICCVTVPSKWKPGLNVTITWENGGGWLLDEKGKEVIRDGKKVLVRGKRKSRTVAIPQYDRPEDLWIHFFPNDEIKLVMSKYVPGHPKHGLPDPEVPGVSK